MTGLTTELKDRRLRFDGVNIVHPDDVAFFLSQGLKPDMIQTIADSEEIEEFNIQVSPEEAIIRYDPNAPFSVDLTWRVPDEYLAIDLADYFIEKLEARMVELGYSDAEFEAAAERVGVELMQVEERGMEEFMQTVIYILDKFRETDQVWGVGRGSSCACYLLFLAGLHVVDCVRMDVSSEEFFHD